MLTQGLQEIVTEGGNRKGYVIYDYICTRCGEAVSAKKGDKVSCPGCKSTTFKKVGEVAADKVEKILNTKLQYKCNTCGKVYDQPTQCCNGEYEVGGDKMVWAYYCTGCKRVYSQRVECCEAEMLEGYYKPESWVKHQMSSHLEIPKISPELMKNLKIGTNG